MHVYRDLNLSGSDSVKVCIAKSRCKVCKESIPKIKCFHSCVHIVPVIVHRQEKFREHIGCMGLALSCPVANKKNIIKSNNQVQHLLNFSTQKVKDKTTCSTPGLQKSGPKTNPNCHARSTTRRCLLLVPTKAKELKGGLLSAFR